MILCLLLTDEGCQSNACLAKHYSKEFSLAPGCTEMVTYPQSEVEGKGKTETA